MREIKFRAYDTHTKIMLPIVDIIKFTKSEGIYITRDSAYGVGINIQYQPHIELMQYTGLKDKNEKEIYEGDIVRFEDIGEDGYEYKEGFDFKNEAQVIYEDGQVTLTNFGEGDNSYYANDGQPDILDEILRNGNCEVIGNIYDNPELSEKGEQS